MRCGRRGETVASAGGDPFGKNSSKEDTRVKQAVQSLLDRVTPGGAKYTGSDEKGVTLGRMPREPGKDDIYTL